MVSESDLSGSAIPKKLAFDKNTETKGVKKLIVIPTTNLLLTLKSNTMKNSMQN